MRRVDNVYEKLLDVDLLKQAITNAARGKKQQYHVQCVLSDIDNKAKELLNILENDAFVPTPFRTEVIHTDTKTRNIMKLPFFPDRCIQHAIALVMLPKWNNVISDNTFASWKERGINSSK